MPTSATPRQKRPEVNAEIYRLLINKLPMRRICEVAGITPDTLYAKLRFLRERVVRFSQAVELPRIEAITLPDLLVSTDRQDYLINWGTAEDRRNIRLHGIGSADNRTGFVFGMHLDYDSALDPGDIEVQAFDAGDYDVEPAFRRHARLWLKDDWQDPLQQYSRRHKHAERKDLPVSDVSDADMPTRWDGDQSKLPGRGMKVRSEYTMIAHFHLLARLTARSPSVLIYMDQDPGMRSACHIAFQDRIRSESAESFFVRIAKDMTVDEKRTTVSRVAARLAKTKRDHPELTEKQLRVKVMEEALRRADVPVKWQDRWVAHPFPSMNEPEKSLCHLTDRASLPASRRAAFHLYGSLHGIDRFFMVLRRRCSLLERPIQTASSSGRVWHCGNAYRPWVVEALLDLMRVAYNYHWPGEDKQTPAMRLGLADAPWSLHELIAGEPMRRPRKKRTA